jgi:hypothetical protein
MLCGAPLGELPILSTSFANCASDEPFEPVFNLISVE